MSKIKPVFTKTLPYFLAFFVPVFIFLGTLVVMPLFGISRSILFQDPNNQYIDFLNYYKTFFQDPSRLFYSFSAGIGSNMVPLVAYYLLSPFNLIVLFFPNESVSYAYLLIVLLKIGTVGLSSFIFFRKISSQPKNHYRDIIFSIAYSLSAFSICYFFHFEWLDALILLPIICLGINKIISDKKPWLYIVALTLSIITNYYMGFMLCIFSVLWFLYQYLLRAKLYQLKSHVKEVWQFVWASLLAGGISAAVVIPTVYSIFLQTGRRAKEDIFNIATQFPVFDIFSQFTSNFIYGMPYLFAGTIITVLVICYFLNQNINIRERILSGGILLIFLFSFNTPLLNAFWHGLSTTNGAPYRYSFIATFFLIYLAYRGFYEIKNISQKRTIATLIIYIISYILVFRKTLDFREHILLIIDFAVATITCLSIYKNTTIKKINLDKRLIILQSFNTVVLMLFNWGFLETVEGGVTSFSSTKEAIIEVSPAINAVKEYDDGFYRMEKTFNRTENDGLQFNYFGTSLYSSSDSEKTKQLLNKFGLALKGRRYSTNISLDHNYNGIVYGDVNTCTTTAILGIKYLISNKDISNNCDYKAVLQSDEYTIYENNYNLPIGMPVNNEYINLFGSMDNQTLPKFLNNFASSITGNEVQPVKTLNRKDYEVEYYNLEKNSNVFTKINTKTNGYIIYRINNPHNKNIYFDVACWALDNGQLISNQDSVDSSQVYRIKADNTEEKINFVDNSILNLGNDTKITIKIEIPANEFMLGRESLFTENITDIKKMYETIIKQKINLDAISQSHLSGEVEVISSGQTLLFTIPYDEGWNIYIDDKEAKTIPIMDNFMAIAMTISPGKHKIEMRFIPRGLIIGVIISLINIALAVTIFIFSRRKNNG